MHLYVVVEGYTEEAFVKQVLAPHLATFSVWAVPIIVTTSRDRSTGAKHRGGGDWEKWKKDLDRLSGRRHRREMHITTLFDLYRLPHNFPDYELLAAMTDTTKRAAAMEAAMAAQINDRRFIPYLQRHEVEAFVLVDLDPLAELVGEETTASGVAALRVDIAGLDPESINDGAETAPSKRLLRFIPDYRKTLHGPLVMEAIGLPKIRAACPRFDAWVGSLEALGADPHAAEGTP